MLTDVPAWAAQDVRLPLWAVLVLAAYSNRRIIDMLRRARSSAPSSTKDRSGSQ